MKCASLALILLFLLSAAGCDNATEIRASVPYPSNLALVDEPQLVAALEAARETIVNHPRRARAWGDLGTLYLVHDWHQEAARCYQHAIALAPDVFRWHFYLGRSLATLQPEKAAAAFARAIAIDPTYAAVHVHAGLVLRRLGRPEQARRHFERAGILDPSNPHSMLNLGQIAATAGQLEAARNYLRQALTLNPQQSEAHSQLARVLMGLGDRQAATRHVEKARAPSVTTPMQDPLWGELQKAGLTRRWFAKRGNKYLRDGDFGYAIAELEIAVAGEQNNPDVWLSYGTALLHAQRYDEARTALESGLAKTGENLDVPATTRTKVSQPNLRSSQKRKPIIEKIHANLGVAATKMGDMELAAQHLEEAWRRNPAAHETARNLAIVYYAQGRLPETIDYLKKAHALRPDPEILRTLKTLYHMTDKRPESTP